MIGTTFAVLYAAHQVGDHWVQTDLCARRKGMPGWVGRRACLIHVGTYTLTLLVFLVAAGVVGGVDLDLMRVAGGLLVSAVSHYVADRRTPMITMCRWLGKGRMFLLDQDGYYKMDQSWHVGWLFVVALIVG
jgi:hypothetical protein